MTEAELDYNDLEFISVDIENVNNLLKIMVGDIFDNIEERKNLSPFGMSFESVLAVAISILNDKAEQIYKIFNMLFDADCSGEYNIPKRQQNA